MFLVVSEHQQLWVARKTRLKLMLPGLDERLEALGKEYLVDTINFRPGGVVLDVGANIGEFTRISESLGTRVFCFEPDRVEFEALKLNVENPQAASNIALWSKTSNRQLFLSNDSGDTSLIFSGSFGSFEEVMAVSLDDWLAGSPDLPATFCLLKLEAEGAEPEILEGCAENLGRFEQVLVDAGFERGPSRESTLPAVANFLVSRGFLMVQLGYPRVTALFVNSKLLPGN